MEENFERNLKKYSKYKNFIKFFCYTLGLWPDKQVQSLAGRIFFRCFSLFAVISCFYGLANYLAKEAHNMNVYLRALGYFISHISFFLKIVHIMVYQNKFEHMDKNISASFEKDIKDFKIQKNAMKHFSRISMLCYANAICVIWSVSSLTVTTILYALVKHVYSRVYPITLPYEYTPGGTVYWLTFLYDFYVLYYSISTTAGADGLFGYYVLHMVGEMGVLRENYLNLKSSKDYAKDIKACLQKHKMIIESLNILQKIFGLLTVWHATSCQIIMCAVLFQVSKMKTITYGRVISLITFLALKATQTYSFAYFGYAINLESEECLQAVYESHWPGSSDKRLMKDIVIMLSQKPMVFKAISILNLNFDMFMNIMNASVSYYMILRTMESKY